MRITLEAEDGMIYTDGVVYGTEIRLEVGRSSEEFRQIPLEEYEKILNEQAENNSFM